MRDIAHKCRTLSALPPTTARLLLAHACADYQRQMQSLSALPPTTARLHRSSRILFCGNAECEPVSCVTPTDHGRLHRSSNNIILQSRRMQISSGAWCCKPVKRSHRYFLWCLVQRGNAADHRESTSASSSGAWCGGRRCRPVKRKTSASSSGAWCSGATLRPLSEALPLVPLVPGAWGNAADRKAEHFR
jgi:hypothetical protein